MRERAALSPTRGQFPYIYMMLLKSRRRVWIAFATRQDSDAFLMGVAAILLAGCLLAAVSAAAAENAASMNG